MNLVSSSPPLRPRNHLRNYLPSPSSTAVPILYEQASTSTSSVPTTLVSRHFPTSVLLQEQRDDYRPSLHIVKDDGVSQSMFKWKLMETAADTHEDNETSSDKFLRDFNHQLLHLPGLSSLLPSSPSERKTSLTKQPVTASMEKFMDLSPCEAISLAKKALSASIQAVSLAVNSELLTADCYEPFSPSLTVTSFVEEKTVRSTRLLERRNKRRKVSRPKVPQECDSAKGPNLQQRLNEGFDQNDPLRLFLGPETKQLLTVEEESELIREVQHLNKLGHVKRKLQYQFDREPTMVEWADAAGLSCRDLQLQLHTGNIGREKLICSNFRMVVHIAKQYQGRGLSFQDLLQEGSMGLMKSVEKFKPQFGCRFPSYAYWWIRQSMRKAIFQHSRTIRLPENLYNLLSKVLEAKKSYIREAHHHPTQEQLAQRVGITVEKLQNLLFLTRMPLSLQQPVWMDQGVTFQEVTADTRIESPDTSVAKQLMRQHVRNLLTTLTPKERQILKLRYGFGSGHQNSLSEIGAVFGLSKERVRQLESRALYKLKQSLISHDLDAYVDLLV
ncbi:hypothetical protein Ancab_014582 [Ancistrocladus abbreviatus]